MPLGLVAAQQTAAILTLEIISRLRLIFRFYKTLHFATDPVSGPGTPAGERRGFVPTWGLDQMVFECPSGIRINLLICRCQALGREPHLHYLMGLWIVVNTGKT